MFVYIRRTATRGRFPAQPGDTGRAATLEKEAGRRKANGTAFNLGVPGGRWPANLILMLIVLMLVVFGWRPGKSRLALIPIPDAS